jgi:hypothetical protein
VVATLGKLTGEEPRQEAGWEQLESLLDGRPAAPRQMRLGEPVADAALAGPRWEVVGVRGVRVERARDFCEAFLGLALWRRLGLHTLLAELIEPGEEEVPWPVVASVLAVARFCGQRSELGVAERWYAHSAMEDLLGVSWEKVNDDRLYRGLDVLAAHSRASRRAARPTARSAARRVPPPRGGGGINDKLCAHLMERYRSWFGVQFEFLLYDVTSTFFEGQAEKNDKAARGYCQRPPALPCGQRLRPLAISLRSIRATHGPIASKSASAARPPTVRSIPLRLLAGLHARGPAAVLRSLRRQPPRRRRGIAGVGGWASHRRDHRRGN